MPVTGVPAPHEPVGGLGDGGLGEDGEPPQAARATTADSNTAPALTRTCLSTQPEGVSVCSLAWGRGTEVALALGQTV